MIVRLLSIATLLLFFTGCSGLNTKKPELSVGINSFTMVPGEGMVPRFEIGLHIVNTSSVDIDIKGIVYKIYLQKRKIVTGAAHDLPKIAAYSETDVKVTGTPDIFETIGFFKDLMSQKKEAIDYVVDVAIDAGSFIPMIHTKKEGQLSLAGRQVPK
ncbi:LEA type 2 family protein [Hydrogenimonas urashimensis]|uniref:LEA type 2 family protein n=1 Tax=Hydrogenimonas urashimensis TaxID=2740515 RepID=UPI0019164FA5|nr:LEA type 2 family protein [Hydrogenimonas urashimensis]